MASRKRIFSVFLSLIFIFLAFVIFVKLIKPLYGETQNLRAEIIKKEENLKNQKLLAEQFQKLLQEYKENQISIQNQISSLLPTSPSIAEALIQINGIANANNINISSFTISKPLSTSLPSAASFSDSNLDASYVLKPIGNFDISIKPTGRYNDIKNFINQLENNIRLFEIKTINIGVSPQTDPSKTKKEDLSIEMVVSAFYQSEN